MALVSPGLEITVTDESQYLPTSVGTIPLVVMATSQNKTINGAVAPGTTKVNAGKLYGISSQRELAATFGYPTFRQSSGGLPLHGNELNEYGLMAAYSALGLGNRVWALRADVDLDQLVGTSIRPTGNPANATQWLDTSATSFGIFEYDRDTNSFTKVSPIIISSVADLTNGVPKSSIGSIGSYAVVVTNKNNSVYQKDSSNSWNSVGSSSWASSIPVAVSNTAAVNIAAGSNVVLNGTTVTISGNITAMSQLDTLINDAEITGVSSEIVNGRLQLFAETTANTGVITGAISVAGGGLASIGITNGVYGRAVVSHGTSAEVPNWKYGATTRPSTSVWIKTSTQGNGTNFIFKKYNSTLDTWSLLSMPLYADGFAALYGLDRAGGGANIAAGSAFVKYNPSNDGNVGFKIYTLATAGQAKVTGSVVPGAFTISNTFTLTVSVAGSTTPSTYTCTINGTGASDFVAAILAQNIPNVTSQIETSGLISITHRAGGIITMTNGTGSPLSTAGFTTATTGVVENIVAGSVNLTNWVEATYTYSDVEPYTDPVTETLWYYNDPTQVDIMINDTDGWKGYKTVSVDARGYNLTQTDTNGVIISPTEPTTQSGSAGSALVSGDLWLDSSDLENYPRLYRYNGSSAKWQLIDNTDRVSQNGIIFEDARWDVSGTTDPITGSLVSTRTMLSSNYIDLDAPDYRLYPRGTLLFNTRRSGFTVKRFVANYFNAQNFTGVLPAETNAWVTMQGTKSDGNPAMGHHAQRNVVLEALRAAVSANTDLREEGYNFTLLTCPGYPELVADLISLNNERANTGFVIGDTPMTLPANLSSINAYNNALTSNDAYAGIYYPSALTFDLSGNEIAVPASHMMLRTFLRSDNVSYPWFAPAGTRRGLVDNAVAIGYVDPNSGLFIRTGISQQLRDSLYERRLNPISLINGAGIVVYGQKTRMPSVGGGGSAMDRVNVARLVNYLRTVLRGVANQFLFEPNDKITRDQVKQLVESVLNDLIAKRGLYDYLVVCDTTNNTSDRIARNELYVDVAIEPMKDVEFIYIPIRLKNPGSISEG